MRFELGIGALRKLRSYVAEYIACQAFRQWIEKKHPEIKEVSFRSRFLQPIKIWTPPPIVHTPRYRDYTTRSILIKLLTPPIYRIHDKGGSYPDLVAEIRLSAKKVERYFIEVKSGEATLDKHQKVSQKLARDEGYIPIVIRIRTMDLEKNSFDVAIEESKV